MAGGDTDTVGLGSRVAKVACHYRMWHVRWRRGGKIGGWISAQRVQDEDVVESDGWDMEEREREGERKDGDIYIIYKS